MFEQSDRRVVDPLDVLDHENHRARPGETLDEQAGAAEDLPAHGLAVQIPDALLELGWKIERQ